MTGQGTIGIANQDEKNSFNMEKGDAIRVPSGSTTYFINRDNKEKLFVYVLSKSAGLPGEVRVIIVVLLMTPVHQKSLKIKSQNFIP